jgi:N-acetylglucosamine malate deacetylase 1
MAHPDDGELWAGGTLALHAREAAVTLAVPQHEPARMAEAKAGAAILSVRLHTLPSPVTAAAVHDESRPAWRTDPDGHRPDLVHGPL